MRGFELLLVGITLLQKGEKTDWKSLDKKKALKYNNLRAFFMNFCEEGGIGCADPLWEGLCRSLMGGAAPIPYGRGCADPL